MTERTPGDPHLYQEPHVVSSKGSCRLEAAIRRRVHSHFGTETTVAVSVQSSYRALRQVRLEPIDFVTIHVRAGENVRLASFPHHQASAGQLSAPPCRNLVDCALPWT
jgi:hypothetical protein